MTLQDPRQGGGTAAAGEAQPPDAAPEKREATVTQAMRKMAERKPDEFYELTAMMGTMGHPLHHKMNEEHIGKMLDLAVQHDKNEFELKSKQQQIDSDTTWRTQLYQLAFFLVFVGLVVFVCVMFSDKPTVLVPILTGVGGVVTGFIGGMGYSKAMAKKD